MFLIAFEGLAWNVISGLLTGLITAAVSVRFALRRFRHERTWERKVQAYSELFDALFHVKRNATIHLQRIEEGGTYNEDYLKTLAERASAGYSAIRKATVIGTFIFSDEATACLTKLEETLDDPHHNDDIHEELSADLDAITKAIDALRPIAKHDLKIG